MYCLKIREENRIYWKNELIHRGNDLPAAEYRNGAKEWYKEGELHRENDLPAIIYAGGQKEWFSNGSRYEIKKYENGTKEYYNIFGRFHRYDGLPAVIYPNGDVEYWVGGKRHRIDGPAVVYGNKQYWFEWGEFKKCIV